MPAAAGHDMNRGTVHQLKVHKLYVSFEKVSLLCDV